MLFEEARRKRFIEMMEPDLRQRFEQFSDKQKDTFFDCVKIEDDLSVKVDMTLTATQLRCIAFCIKTRDPVLTVDLTPDMEHLYAEFMAILGLAILPHVSTIFNLGDDETRH